MTRSFLASILALLILGAAPAAAHEQESSPPLSALPALDHGAISHLDASAWNTLHGEDFVIYHAGRRDTAHTCGQLLEHTRDVFIRSFGEAGVALSSHRPTLEWVVFSSRAAFDRYAREADRADPSWMQGYYSARTNRVALVLHGSMTAAGEPVAGFHAEQPWDLQLASVTHEAAHQLAFNLGLQRRGVVYPLWASEGLATNFEALWWDAPLGPSAANPYRQNQLRQVVEAGRLLELRELIVLVRPPVHDPEAIDAIYAQSWALFRFLLEQRPLGLRAYFDALSAHEPHVTRSSLLRDAFARSLGDPAELEAAWQTYVRQLIRTPDVRSRRDVQLTADR